MENKLNEIKTKLKFERTLVLIKPDGVQRELVGRVITRFEEKGLKLVGLKMMAVDDTLVASHYGHLLDKPFYKALEGFIKSSPLVAMVWEGVEAVSAVRLITGCTKGRDADAGTIRGDFAMSVTSNIVHSSDSLETAEKEIYRFFNDDELFSYDKTDYLHVYAGASE